MPMTNDEKLEFIKANYKASRAFQLLEMDFDSEYYTEWIDYLCASIPRYLYKYRVCNENNLNSLKNRKAWFSNPSTWNDPIDATVKYNLAKDLKDLEDNFDDYVVKFAFTFINKYIDSFCKQKKFVEADVVKKVYYSCFKGEERINYDKIVEKLKPVVGEKPAMQIAVKAEEAFNMVLSDDFKTKVLSGLNNFAGFNDIKDKCIMYSLSETYNNNHQWAMYADGGKGFCIGYEIIPKSNHEISLLTCLVPIYYGDKKEIRLTRILDECVEYGARPESLDDLISQESENLFISMHTKNIEWNGEQEWRFCLPLVEAKSNLVDFDFARVLYLGDKIDEDWKRELIDIARMQKLKVYQRKLDKMKSDWLYEELSVK